MTRMSLRRFAKILGVSHSRVSEAIGAGRLAQSIGRDPNGRPFVADLKLARREWRENRSRPAPGRTRRDDSSSRLLVNAQVDVTAERARALRWHTDQAMGKLVSVEDVVRLNARLIVATRSALLAIPTKLKQARPLLTREDVSTADRLIREALETLADSAPGANGHGSSNGNGQPHDAGSEPAP